MRKSGNFYWFLVVFCWRFHLSLVIGVNIRSGNFSSLGKRTNFTAIMTRWKWFPVVFIYGNDTVTPVTIKPIFNLFTFSWNFISKYFCQYVTPFGHAVLLAYYLQQISLSLITFNLKSWPKPALLNHSKCKPVRRSLEKEAEACVLPWTDKFLRGLVFINEVLHGLFIANELCILI